MPKRNIILFDQDLQRYREPIYEKLRIELREVGYDLYVFVDSSNCDESRNIDRDYIISLKYNLTNFITVVVTYRPSTIIQFVWLRYKFILPFMIFMRLASVPVIVWSHGINLQRRDGFLNRLPYLVRQLLAKALIIYTPNELKYIVFNKARTFIANNTLAFDEIDANVLRRYYKSTPYVNNKKVILSVARWNVNNRDISDVQNLADMVGDDYLFVIVGSGISSECSKQLQRRANIKLLGPITDSKLMDIWYHVADIFVMPGAIGLAINQSFYHGVPILLKDVPHGPEYYYFEDKVNGRLYGKDRPIQEELRLIEQDLNRYSYEAKTTADTKMNLQIMLNGIKNAIKSVS